MQNLSLLRFPALVALFALGARGVVACAGAPPAHEPVPPPPNAPSAPSSEPPKTAAKELEAGVTEKWLAADGATVFERETNIKRDAAEIQAVIHAHAAAFNRCYDKARASDPKLAGRVEVRFTILPTGHVENAKDEHSTLASPSAIACMVAAYGKLKFPAVKGATTTMVYPLTFEPKN